MITPPDTSRSAIGGDHADGALLRAVAAMRPGWIVLRGCALADGDGHAPPARVRYALLHPKIGIALLDILPGATTLGARDRLRRLLDAAEFRRAFGDYPPIVYLCVPLRTLSGLEPLLAEEFDLLPPLALAGADAWVGAAQRVLTAGPPLRVPGRMAAGGQPPPRPPERVEGRFVPQLDFGLRGIAVFWGVVTLAFGSGAVVLHHLGPPEEHVAVARTGVGPEEPPAPQTAPEARPATAYPDKAWPPSPDRVLAVWPAERTTPRSDAAHANAANREPGDVAGGDPRAGGDRSARTAATAPNRPQRPSVSGAHTEAYPASAAKFPAGAETADNEGAPANAPKIPFVAPRVLLPGLSAQADGRGRTDAAPASARPASDGTGMAPRRTLATVAAAPGEEPTDAPARPADVPAAPVPAGNAFGEGDPAAATESSSQDSTWTDTSGERESGAESPPRRTAVPAAPPPPVAEGPGAPESVHTPRSASPADPAPAVAEAPPAATPETAAARDAASSPPPAAVGGAPDATPGAAGAAAAPRAAEAEAPPSPHLSPAAPAQASVPVVAPSEAPGGRSPDDRAGADVRPRPEAVEPVAGAAAPGAPRAPDASTARDEGPAPAPPSAANAPSAEPPADPGPSAPRTAAAPPDAETPPVAAAEPAPSGRNPLGETPAGGTALGAAPAQESVQPATAPPQSVTTAPLPRDATPNNGPPPARNADPAQPLAGVPVARPATPEPDSKAAGRADDATPRVPAASASPALVEALIARGDAMVARRDISAARLLYERAAAGDARAATALARTYDPAFLAEMGVRGIRGDAALAMTWYRKAISLGDSGALARVEALNGGPDRPAPGRP
jgi:hypothetical protein